MIADEAILDAKLLVVDDEPANVELLEEMLADAGYRNVRSLTDPRRVEEAYREWRPHLVALDLNMPHMDGFQVMEQLRAIDGEDGYLPVLVLTAYQDREIRYRALRAGARDFLTKPFDLMEVLLRIRSLLEVRLLYDQTLSLNAQLTESNADLERFAFVASHDLQEPLRSVTRYVQMLDKRYSDALDEKGVGYIGRAVEGTKRMQALILSLLDYARVGSRGEMFTLTDVDAVVDGAASDLSARIDEVGAEVTRDALPRILADQGQLAQLLQNLIGNAIKFCGDDAPTVHVSAEQQDDAWVFAVADNGIGIEPEYGEQIFEIFQRLHGRGSYDGTGIGLAICRKIVQRHGGRIWVDSQPGEGATFRFTIPRR
ncbi:hybrid sensor histidine kinase/response regulator [Candidatus Poribacteria bacterium]|nr:hybrid sensor histidine kinase/response regulator [Candidatus Poribacteria bacterium]